MRYYYFWVVIVIVSTSVYAQKFVTEVKYEKDKIPLSYLYLPNLDRLVIQSGSQTSKKYGNVIQDISSYDTDGFVEKLLQKENLVNCVFSPMENAFLIGKMPNSNTFPVEYKLVIDSKPSKFFKLEKKFRYFNDVYGFNLINQKNEYGIKLDKDKLFLEVVDLFSNTSEKFELKKPDLTRLENKVTTAYLEGLNFDVKINESSIGIITKSINKNYKSANIYRTLYNLNGEQIADLSYFVSVPNHFLIFSNNGGGVINQNADEIQISELAINNYIVDQETGEIYIYGLFGNEGKSPNYLKNIPLGIYVFKFDKSGRQIWQSIQEINDVTGFNSEQEIQNIRLQLKVRNDAILIWTSSVKEKKFLDYVVLNQNNGEKSELGKSKYSFQTSNNNNYFIATNLNVADFPNVQMDIETLVALQICPEITSYIKSHDASQNMAYKTFIGKKGFWLLETDNINFYKVAFFNKP